MHKYIFSILLLSNVFSQECGNSQCDELETYINCISDCPITIENLVWVNDTPVHVDDEQVTVSVNSVHLENLIAIQFKIYYDHNILDLNVNNCSGDNTSDCELVNNSASYLTNTSTPGVLQGIVYSGMPFNIDGQFLNIQFNVIGGLGDYSNIIINQFDINDIDIINYVQDGLVTIGNFGCMDQAACNYSTEATFDDGSCEFELDCLEECGGTAILDENDVCCSFDEADCMGICGGSALEDECGVCNGNMFIDEYGLYPDGTCDCNGLKPPYVYCLDLDGDLLGNPDLPLLSCVEIPNNPFLVLDCTDIDDDCPEYSGGSVDECGVCGGDGIPDDECDCNSVWGGSPNYEDCAGVCGGDAIVDECGECGGNGPEEGYDCEGNFLNISQKNLLENFHLLSVYPNPFNPSLSINYLVDSYSFISINILDINGKHIKKIKSEIHVPGEYHAIWIPEAHIPSGIYIIQVNSLEETVIKKVNYIK